MARLRMASLRFLGPASLTLALLPAAAVAKVDTYGKVTGSDRAGLRHLFHAQHPDGYRIVGYHASVRFDLRYAGVYWMKTAGGQNAASGVAIFRRRGRGWRAVARPSRRVLANLGLGSWTYAITISATGGYQLVDTNTIPPDDPSDPDETTEVDRQVTEMRLALSGTVGTAKRPYIVNKGSEALEDVSPTAALLTGSGSYRSTDSTDPAAGTACDFTVRTDNTQFDLHWERPASVGIDVGRPTVDAPTGCGARDPSDPQGDGGSIELAVPAATAPWGTSFTLPISIHHTAHHVYGGTDVQDETLAFDGSVGFALVGVRIPDMA